MKIVLFGIFLIGMCLAEPQLQLVNVVFRHGDRTLVAWAMFPTDPHFNSSFYPIGYGGLTNDGKYRVYQLGQFLRTKYRDLLGDVYLPNLLYAQSTDFDRTKMSLQLVLAVLFPPSDIQRWNGALDWQSIPFTALPKHLDDILGVISLPSFKKEQVRVIKMKDIQSHLNRSKEFINNLEKLTGKKMTNIYGITQVYDTLYAESKMNLTLPSWTAGMFPDGELLDAALINYDVLTYDKKMLYELAGKLITKIREDILAFAGKLKESKRKKLCLYSGHDFNVVGTLKYLRVYKRYIPTYASAAIIELYKEKDKRYVKVLYYHGDSKEAEEMTMPGCSILCPLEKYLDVVNEMLK